MPKTYRELSGVHGHNLTSLCFLADPSDYSIPITGMSHTTARQYKNIQKRKQVGTLCNTHYSFTSLSVVGLNKNCV